MPIKMSYMGFSWDPNFPKGNIITKYFVKDDKITTDINETNVLVIGSTLTIEEYEIVKYYSGLRLLFLSEPISKLEECKITNELFESGSLTGADR